MTLRLTPRAAAKREQRRRANFGTKRRHAWWHEQPCACEGKHPACMGGRSDPSHTKSKAVEGDERTIIPQSRGCHDFIGSKGWLAWERRVAEDLGMDAPFVVEDEFGYRLDRHALAASFAMRGPDAPGAA